ncbi:family 78 glycoside hydrolase catalytic domain [Streptomyces sp. NPDC003393]
MGGCAPCEDGSSVPPPPWPDDKGFLGKPADTDTGLTRIGAREYDPTTGRFLSVDPVLAPDDHESLNGYAYANNTPVTKSDSSGKRPLSGCEIRVGSSAGGADVWDSGKVGSDQSVDVGYGGPALTSHTGYHWSVRVWDDQGTASGWSDDATFETGLLDASEWQADWIGANPADRFGPQWRDYTISFTASGISGALGVYFRGSDANNAYMWQLSESQRALRPHVKKAGGYSVLSATPFPAGFDFATSHKYEIAVAGSTITTSVDGSVLDKRSDATFTGPGIVGFRTSGTERGLVKQVQVTSADGTVLVDDSFPPGDHTFEQGTVTANGLLVDGNGGEAWLGLGHEVPLLRKTFHLQDKPIASARLYATAEGLYQFRLNGARVGDQELAPGVTDYNKRIDYQTHDVTKQLHAGDNAIGAQLARGWYSGRVAMFGDQIWGANPALIGQLRVQYADGSTQTVGTDDTWRTTPGPITSADLLDGESYDARRGAQVAGWDTTAYDAAAWTSAVTMPSATKLLEPASDQPVRDTQKLAAHRIASPTPGTYIYDLGQNMVGVSRVTLTGQASTTARIRHAEVLNPDGTIYTDNLRSARATDYYTFTGTGTQTYQPTFTFHGFRYIEISGVAQAPADDQVTGIVMGTDTPRANSFSTSSGLVNQLHSNITWGQRGNFLSIPTDTPARDERMGWTGDIDVFSRTAAYNMDSQAFLSKWLQDLRDTQNATGSFPGVAPTIPGKFDGGYGSAGWADAGVHVPWVLWQAYGDLQVVRDNYDAMKRYVDYLDRDSTNHIRSAGGYLDWLNLDDATPADVLDTAFVARSTHEFAQMAAAIGHDADAAAYQQRFEAIRQAYQQAFIAADGTVKGNSQTSYVLTINNGLVPADRAQAIADKFVQTIKRHDWHLSIGFLGVDGLLPALSKIGRSDIAYRLLQNRDYPSWGYEIGKGATTVWERWNSIMPDGSFGPVGMNSFNHYAYGAVGEWMSGTLAGVSPRTPGYHSSTIAPEPGDGIDWAKMAHETPYGTIASTWHKTDAGLTLDVTVPANTTASVRVPTAANRWAVTESGKAAEDATGVTYKTMTDGAPVFEVGSGSYHFAVDDVLGHLGSARATGTSRTTAIDALAAKGGIDRGTAGLLDAQAGKLADQLEAAWQTRLVSDDTVAAVHAALSTAADLQRWIANKRRIGQLDATAAATLTAPLATIADELSAASGLLVGAVAQLTPPADGVLPGDSVTATVSVRNSGTSTLKGLGASLTAPAGWTVVPTGPAVGDIPAGATGTQAYRVTAPMSAAAGSVTLTGEAHYAYHQSTASLPVSATLAVNPAVTVDSVTPATKTAGAGATDDLAVLLTNHSAVVQQRTVQVSPPDGWAAVAPQQVTVPAHGTSTVTARVAVPMSVTEGPASVGVATGTTEQEKARATIGVVFTNPPTSFLDYVDLGNATSESAHQLAASQHSGTNVEAGLTRRYTNSAYPGGWFEMDVKVPTDRPFVLRMVETYDSAQLKTYDVQINGVVVHQRRYQRTQGGQGSLSYQFVVDRPDLVGNGVVRLRFQDVGTDYDPSIADLWAISQ